MIIFDLNKAGLRNTHKKREEVIGKKVTEVFPSVKEIGLFEVFQSVHKTGEPAFPPLVHYKDETVELWAENHVFKLPSGLIVAVYEDSTDRRHIE